MVDNKRPQKLWGAGYREMRGLFFFFLTHTCNHSVFNEKSSKFMVRLWDLKLSVTYADLAMGKIDHKAKCFGPVKPVLYKLYRYVYPKG